MLIGRHIYFEISLHNLCKFTSILGCQYSYRINFYELLHCDYGKIGASILYIHTLDKIVKNLSGSKVNSTSVKIHRHLKYIHSLRMGKKINLV